MIGRAFDRRATSWNPAARNVAGNPTQANGAGTLSAYGSIGYPSTILAPRERA